MRILFLSDNFPPEVNAPASRTYEHCREWVKAGADVTVITCAPNFPKGKVFDGYKNRLYSKEKIDGITVIRVWSFISANEGFVSRIVDYVSFMVSATIASCFVKKPSVIVGTSPQFFTACAAYLTSRLRRVPYVFELRDIWPESIKTVGAMKESRVLRWLEKLELFLYRKARMIVSVTQGFKVNLINRGIDGNKIEVVTNGVDLSRFSPLQKDEQLVQQLGWQNKFVAGYIGTHGMAHALETIVLTAEIFQNEYKDEDTRFLFLGDGAKKAGLVELAKSKNLSNVVFIDTVPKAEVSKYWSLLDVSIVHLNDSELFKTVIPSKIFECMAMGIPILHGVRGESADIVSKENAGLLFAPENHTELAERLQYLKKDTALRKNLSDNAIAAAPNYNRVVLAEKMLGLLKKAAEKKDTLS